MTNILESPPEAIAQAKSRVESAGARLLNLLAHVPDDRLTWSPSPTSRSALVLVGHCARASGFFADTIAGRIPETQPSPEAFIAALRGADKQVAGREETVAALEQSQASLVAALDAVRAEDLDVPRASPFGVLPVAFWAEQSAGHLAGHTDQLAYLQTVWGDLDDHRG